MASFKDFLSDNKVGTVNADALNKLKNDINSCHNSLLTMKFKNNILKENSIELYISNRLDFNYNSAVKYIESVFNNNEVISKYNSADLFKLLSMKLLGNAEMEHYNFNSVQKVFANNFHSFVCDKRELGMYGDYIEGIESITMSLSGSSKILFTSELPSIRAYTGILPFVQVDGEKYDTDKLLQELENILTHS